MLLSFDMGLAGQAVKQLKEQKEKLDPAALEKSFGQKGKAMFATLDIRVTLLEAILNLFEARKEILGQESQLNLLSGDQMELAKKLGFK